MRPVRPYAVSVHAGERGPVIEVRPRAGTWAPFLAAVPIAERDVVRPHIGHGPPGRHSGPSVITGPRECESDDRKWWIVTAIDAATPTHSYFIYCSQLP